MGNKTGRLCTIATIMLVGMLVLLQSCTGNETPNSHVTTGSPHANPEVLRMLGAELERQLAALPPRLTSTPPMSIASQTLLHLSNGTQLDWSYVSPGDYDQNGEVNSADLTPLAIHFQESAAPFTFPVNSIQAVIDGDNNGEINLADITPIALNYQTTVDSFNIYRSQDQADYPGDDPTDGNGQAEEILQIPFLNAIGNAGETRVSFSATIPEQLEGDWLWLRPVNIETEGIASNMVGPVDPPGFSIRGKIDDPHSSIPSLNGVAVYLFGTGITTLTGSEGNFEFENITAGDYTVLPYSTELYFEPSQLGTTVMAGDIEIPVISAYPINTAHSFGYVDIGTYGATDMIVLGADVNSRNEVLLAVEQADLEPGGGIPLIMYGPTHELAWATNWDSGFPDNFPSVAANPNGSFLMVCSTELMVSEEEHWFYSLVNLSNTGQILWKRKWGSLDRDANQWGVNIEPALDGGYYISGSIHNVDISTEAMRCW